MALIAKAVIVGKREEPVVERPTGSSFNEMRAEAESKTVIRPQVEPIAKQPLLAQKDSSYLRDLMNDK